jgi:hypothetical protein
MKLNVKSGIIFIVLSLVNFVIVKLISNGLFGYNIDGNYSGSGYTNAGTIISIIFFIIGIILVLKNQFEKSIAERANAENSNNLLNASVGDYLIESGSDLKSVLNALFIYFFVEMFLGIIAVKSLYEKTSYNNYSNKNPNPSGLFILMALISLGFGIYVIIKTYSGYNNLIKAGKKFNSEKS